MQKRSYSLCFETQRLLEPTRCVTTDYTAINDAEAIETANNIVQNYNKSDQPPILNNIAKLYSKKEDKLIGVCKIEW